MPKVPKEERVPKPKMLFKLVIEMYDNGHIGKEMKEYRVDEEIQKRRCYSKESAQEFREAIRTELAQNDYVLARDILISMGIDPKEFAHSMINIPAAKTETAFVEAKKED
jgi:hypothetical protein